MWVFMNDAFLSVVKNRNDDSGVVVRARVKGDLENVFGQEHEVIESDNSDYRFRMFLDQKYVSDVIAKRVDEIEYNNFKNSISKNDYERKSYYTRVWSVMFDWQERLYERAKKWWLTYR